MIIETKQKHKGKHEKLTQSFTVCSRVFRTPQMQHWKMNSGCFCYRVSLCVSKDLIEIEEVLRVKEEKLMRVNTILPQVLLSLLNIRGVWAVSAD